MDTDTPLHAVMRDAKLRDTELAEGIRAAGHKVTSQQINKVRRGRAKASPELAREIERYFRGRVTRPQLRPDVFDGMIVLPSLYAAEPNGGATTTSFDKRGANIEGVRA